MQIIIIVNNDFPLGDQYQHYQQHFQNYPFHQQSLTVSPSLSPNSLNSLNEYPLPEKNAIAPSEEETLDCHNSRSSILQVADGVRTALLKLGHHVLGIFPISGLQQLTQLVLNQPCDLIFNLCESLDGDSGMEIEIARTLEELNIPFTGNGSDSLHYALDKFYCNSLLSSHSVQAPDSIFIDNLEDIPAFQFKHARYIVKPNDRDGSEGIDFFSVVSSKEELECQMIAMRAKGYHNFLVQQYIDGREINLAFLNPKKEGLWNFTEITFSYSDSSLPHILNYDSKWNEKSPEFNQTPSAQAHISLRLREKLLSLARKSIDALNMKSYGRIDFRVDQDENPYVIDVNPNCDLSDSAGFANGLRLLNHSYEKIVNEIAMVAVANHRARNARLSERSPKVKNLEVVGRQRIMGAI
jgi:D-alanine-D-alanine ligase